MFILAQLISYSLILFLGLILGSYLNSWMWRVHLYQTEENASWWQFAKKIGKRSRCVHCSRELCWFENIPLLSFAALRGRCKTCKKKIPSDYFFVELFSALSLVFVAAYFTGIGANPWLIGRDIFFIAILIVVFVYDLKYMIVLTDLVWAAAAVGFLINYFFLGYNLFSLALGFVVGGGFFLAQYLVSRGKWIGGGDIRIGVMMGLWLGWPGILLALFLSYIIGTLVMIPFLILKKKELGSQIPFGTFLAVGTFITIFWGNQIIGWYLGLL